MSQDPIRLSRPFFSGRELHYLAEAAVGPKLGGGGSFTGRCEALIRQRFGIHRVILTNSCTAALEMSAMLVGLKPGDEVIMPSFTFVSTALAACRVGATPVFVDIRPDTFNLDERLIEAAITPATRAIFPVHYAAVGCAMDRILEIAAEHRLWVVEDAAHGVNARLGGRALGGIAPLGCYSFDELKNFTCGQGGALCVNQPELVERAEILRDKGTDRQRLFRGEVDRYTWVDEGSNYGLVETSAAFLLAQLEAMDDITLLRRELFQEYQRQLAGLQAESLLRLPVIPPGAESNFHIFAILLPDEAVRDGLMAHLKSRGVQSAFHFIPLHSSPMGRKVGITRSALPVTDRVSGALLRLPLYPGLTGEQQQVVVREVTAFLTRTNRRFRDLGATPWVVRPEQLDAGMVN